MTTTCSNSSRDLTQDLENDISTLLANLGDETEARRKLKDNLRSVLIKIGRRKIDYEI